MELFNKFRDTVFLKEDSNLEKQINELKQISILSKDIEKDIRKLELGLQGEKEIAFELKHANIGMYVLHDVTISYKDLKAQIDYIIITKGYVYLVECKNMIGDITVDQSGQFTREYMVNGKKYKESFYSPYQQANRHKDVLKKQWLDKHHKIITLLQESTFDKLWYKPLVVFANPKGKLDIKYAPKEIKNNIIRADNLVQYIQNDLDHYDKSMLCGQKSMLELANHFLEMNVDEYSSFANKYKEINNNGKLEEELINKLKLFRKEKSITMKVPAYYIFTDEELNQIIIHKPKTVEELQFLKILSNVKIKCHGEEIISILNKK